MKAIQVHEFGGPEVLQFDDVEKPVPKENEILIQVHASSLNPVDAKAIQKDSRYKSSLTLPVIPGMDIAGVVEMVGEGVSNIQQGQKVFGEASVLRNGSGAFAEYAVTSEDSIALMPSNMNFIEAASLPLIAASAYQAIEEFIQLKKGQKILIHGGSGGIGSIAIQLARNKGAYVATTASGDGIAFTKELGADAILDYKANNFDEKLKNFDAVLDTVGGDTYRRSFAVLKAGGIIVSMLEKPDEELMKKHNVKAFLEMTKIDRKILSEVARLVEQGVIRVHVDKTYPLSKTREAYALKEQERVIGKIAIEVKHDQTKMEN